MSSTRSPATWLLAGTVCIALACATSPPDEASTEEPASTPALSEAAPEAPAAELAEGDPLALTREVLLEDPDACFRGFAPYCIRDRAFVDPLLERSVDFVGRGKAPTTREEAEAVVFHAVGRYKNAHTRSEEGRALLEELMRDYYAKPTVFRHEDGGRLVVEMGVLPGRVVKYGRTYSVESDLLVDGQWKGTEAASMLERFTRAHPDAQVIDLEIYLPDGSSWERWNYRYHRDRDQISVHHASLPTHAYLSDKVRDDFGPWTSGARSLKTTDLDLCRGRDNMTNQACPL